MGHTARTSVLFFINTLTLFISSAIENFCVWKASAACATRVRDRGLEDRGTGSCHPSLRPSSTVVSSTAFSTCPASTAPSLTISPYAAMAWWKWPPSFSRSALLATFSMSRRTSSQRRQWPPDSGAAAFRPPFDKPFLCTADISSRRRWFDTLHFASPALDLLRRLACEDRVGKVMRDAVRNKECWKRRCTPTQDPSTSFGRMLGSCPPGTAHRPLLSAPAAAIE